ncbi:aminotransferase class I/II-fold pyridoxal phosphate-dependent enzyme [Paludibacterium yongneupense]|uniref:aminotransferase class I/II-fold pyridoxal phosphate-dependent enzyme n=1 Tax=Paludibacterium yongneupense TaxID=400061 RepID=UPI0004018703|nr:aminotransferase class I/II-fold pyridoxal phosphate-dependent enzyme [Paludibacterium yongneupense]
MTAFYLSQRVLQSELSPNAAASQRAKALKGAGADILDLTIGEPDFETPAAVKAAAAAAMARGETRYTPALGTAQLRAAISAKFERENGFSVPPERIAVANGAKQVINNAFAATLEGDSEVIVPSPYYPSFPEMVRLNGGRAVIVPTRAEDGFRLGREALEAAIGEHARWLVINTPSNPSGADYRQEDLLMLAGVLRRHPHLLLLLDEVYEHIRFVEPAPHFLTLAPDLADRVLVVNAVSKTYAMTGWRIGFGAGPLPLIRAMGVIQSQTTSGASSIGQAAALAALNGDQSLVAERAAIYRERRDILVAGLSAIDGIHLQAPDGGLFVFASCRHWLGAIADDGTVIATDSDFVDYLLTRVGVAAVPGSAFGAPGHFRLSIAVETAAVAQAPSRIAAAVAALRAQGGRHD